MGTNSWCPWSSTVSSCILCFRRFYKTETISVEIGLSVGFHEARGVAESGDVLCVKDFNCHDSFFNGVFEALVEDWKA
jgi:hypothetical protein